jgi:GTPase SAR1 family protein
MSIQIQPNKFDLKSLKTRSSYLIIGEKHSGKTTLIKELIHYFDKDCNIKTGFIYCNSKSDLSVYNNFCSNTFIYNDFNLMLEKAINKQEQFNKEYKTGKHKETYEKDSSLLVVIDDIIDMSLVTNNTHFMNIIFNGHYYNITLIISIQSVNIFPSNLRQNFNMIFLFNTDNEREIKQIYYSFGGIYPSEKIFKSVLQEYTKDYQTLIIDFTGRYNVSLNDNIRIYKTDKKSI